MRSAVLLISIALLLAGPPGAHTPDQPPEPGVTLPAALARVLSDYEVAWRNKDAAALAALFAEDGFVLSNGAPPVRGRLRIQFDGAVLPYRATRGLRVRLFRRQCAARPAAWRGRHVIRRVRRLRSNRAFGHNAISPSGDSCLHTARG